MHEPTMDLLIRVLIDGDQAAAVSEVKKLLAAHVDREHIVTEGVEAAMAQLDAKCTVEQFNLLEIMLAGRAVMEVMKEIYPFDLAREQIKGVVVLASLEGDVHDLGKNILKMVLTAKGYRVVDCGKDCPLEDLVDAAKRENAVCVGVSSLITSVIPKVRQVKHLLFQTGLEHIEVIAGGAALKQSTSEGLNVDFVAQDAFEGLHYLENAMSGHS